MIRQISGSLIKRSSVDNENRIYELEKVGHTVNHYHAPTRPTVGVSSELNLSVARQVCDFHTTKKSNAQRAVDLLFMLPMHFIQSLLYSHHTSTKMS